MLFLCLHIQLCRLGKLWALVKNAGEGGIMPLAPNNSTGTCNDAIQCV